MCGGCGLDRFEVNRFLLCVLERVDANRIVMAAWMCTWCCKTHCDGCMNVAWACVGEEAGARNLAFFCVKWLQPAMKGTSYVWRLRLGSFRA